MCVQSYDVVIVGSGIAGIAAALSARELGARVLLATDGTLCGGSSFSDNTWGLGMVSESSCPLERGHQSLSKALNSIGMGLCTPTLPERLIHDADDALRWWMRQGATIIDAADPTQREFVPCFDGETRTWHGFVGSTSKDALRHRIHDVGIDVAEHTTMLEIATDADGQVIGIFTLHKMSVIRYLRTRSVVVATGGLAGLYASHICPATSAIGHLSALEAGARLVNVEFQQLMVGYLSPLWGTVYNEKLWRHSLLETENMPIDQRFYNSETLMEALEAHSWHGPFTFERQSRLVEEVLSDLPRGAIRARVRPECLGPQAPEFVRTYATWIKDAKGADLRESLPIALFAHSSNGGIAIDQDGHAGIPGLYAAGEVAGGIHGADRIGGLASMSALVFGIRAGRAAASEGVRTLRPGVPPSHLGMLIESQSPRYRKQVARTLDEVALVPRKHRDLTEGRSHLANLLGDLNQHSVAIPDPTGCQPSDVHAVAAHRASTSAIIMADALLTAMDARRESRGAHWRSDAPHTDRAFDHQLPIFMGEDSQLVVEGYVDDMD